MQLYPDQVAGVALLDSTSPQQCTKIADWPMFYEMFRRAAAVLPSLARFGVGRVIYSTAYGDLPALARDEERVFMATPRDAQSVRDEFSQIRTTMTEAQALTTLGDRPLGVLTAERTRGRMDDSPARLAALSTNSLHRTLANADHATLAEDQTTAAQSSQAIRDVVNAIRSSTPGAGQPG